NRFAGREIWFAAVAILLAFWHPFATALFLSFYFGFYLESYRQHGRHRHIQAAIIFIVCAVALAAVLGRSPRTSAMPLGARLFGALVSYETNEVNLIASVAAWLMTYLVVF